MEETIKVNFINFERLPLFATLKQTSAVIVNQFVVAFLTSVPKDDTLVLSGNLLGLTIAKSFKNERSRINEYFFDLINIF